MPQASQIMEDDPDGRYRVVRVDGHGPTGTPYTVAGFFEPATGLLRGEGAVVVYRDGALVSLKAPVRDHPMAQHFSRILDYFQDRGPNPCPVDQALRTVRQLHEWSAVARVTEAARLAEAVRELTPCVARVRPQHPGGLHRGRVPQPEYATANSAAAVHGGGPSARAMR